MQLSGSEMIVKCLLEQNVDTVFGYPGGAIMPLYDALYDAPIRHVLTVHEQGAAHAADGYARSCGKVGVCIATSGPGATNLVTGLATAFMDSSPVVAITGQVATPFLGRDAFQEIDIVGMTMSVTKHNFLVRDLSSLAETVRMAFRIAASGRPGPVLIDVPRDILLAQGEFVPGFSLEKENASADASYQQAVISAVDAISNSERPVMLVGGGIKAGQTWEAAQKLADTTGIPAVSTLMGLGTFSAKDDGFLGMTGMHGHKTANWAVSEADVILGIGTRFNDRITGDCSKYAQGKTIIHLDVDPAEVSKNIPADIMIIGDLRQTLNELNDLFLQRPPVDFSGWRKKIANWRQEFPIEYKASQLNAPWIMKHMSENTAGQSVVWVTDVGQHQMWAAQHLQIGAPREWISPGGLGTMGFGLPAAIGAQIACPDKQTVLVVGDGGFKMTGMELYTAIQAELPLIIVIINNQALGMVRQWQELFFQQRYSATILPRFDFVSFSHACGASAAEVFNPSEFASAFAQALQSERAFVIVANVETGDLVDPMVSPGQSINQFVR
ncbi:MAG: biosynthetic-type acetolactate synthase large subunit [Negativicutes bacterium]